MRVLLRSPLFVWFICVRMWGRGVLPATLPAPFSATLSPALLVYLCRNVGPQGLLVVRLTALLVPHSASLSPPTATGVLSSLAASLRLSFQSGEMFIFFYFLGGGLPCRSIFCQFWLCREAQCVYLHRHLGSPQNTFCVETNIFSKWNIGCLITCN